jgi:hypothetical protein
LQAWCRWTSGALTVTVLSPASSAHSADPDYHRLMPVHAFI